MVEGAGEGICHFTGVECSQQRMRPARVRVGVKEYGMCMCCVLTDIEAPPDPGPESRGPFSLRKYQLETGNLQERVREKEEKERRRVLLVND